MTAISATAALRPFSRLSLAGRLNHVGVLAAVAALIVRLWPDWRHNPDLSHGLFMPVVFAWLVHEARTRGAARFLPASRLRSALFFVLLLGALLALCAAGLYAAALDWSSAIVNFALTASLAALLGATLVADAGENARVIGLNWTAVVAAGLWLLCAPIPPGTYTRLTLALQFWVTEAVLRTLHILGIAAIRHGNIIELARTTVGVEEACSGIRSLISCVFVGLLFSATLVRRPGGRVLMVALAAPLALAMNFLRSLTLTLLSNGGVEIRGTWHDVTGFAVLGVTAVILGAIALLLERGEKDVPAPAAAPAAVHPAAPRLQRWLSAGLAVAAALVLCFVLNTRSSPHRNEPPPDLFALLPESPAGWQVSTTDLYEFSGTLRTDHLAQRRYVRPGSPDPTEITLYVAYWPPGQAPVSLVASHTPDACWPGAGWTPLRTASQRATLVVDRRALPDAEYRLFKTGDGYPQHVWFWHLYDGRPIAYRDPYSAIALLHIALKYGFRHNGDQLFVRVSSNRPWSELAGEPLLAEFFARTRHLGL